ncbi:MAG: RrF2 family transcriptional regulator [Planctomycetota bacterium]
MFRFTRKVDYSLLLLSELSLGEGQSARCLAERYHLSPSLVANLLKLLVRAGLVQSIRGKSGGYVLARAQESITLADVISRIDGPYSLVDCLDSSGEKSCDCHDKNLSRSAHEAALHPAPDSPATAASAAPQPAQLEKLVQLQDNVAELLDDDSCSMTEVCPCRPLFSLMHDEIMAIMRKYTIADIHKGRCGTREASSQRPATQPASMPV